MTSRTEPRAAASGAGSFRSEALGDSRRDVDPALVEEPVAGFTLIELTVVLVIMGLALALVVSRGVPVSPATEARAAAREIAGALRAARATALMTNRSQSFSLDLANHSYRWGEGAPAALPADLALGLLTSRDQVVADGLGSIRFDPDGGASGGRITIAGGGRIWWVGVDWISGRVSVEEKR